MRILAILILSLGLAGCATNFKATDGIEIGFEADAQSVGVGFEFDVFDVGCSLADAVSWNAAENMLCDDDEVGIPEAN